MATTAKKRDAEVITLGSGDLMIKEYTGTIPEISAFSDTTDLLGRISGGASIEYKPSFYETADDSGKVKKTIITDEEATFKSGVITWNGKTLAKLSATAAVSEAGGKRTVKIGGVGNNDGKSYALCFHHKDPVDGDVWLIVRAVNQGGFSLTFAKDKESVIDAEFKCLPQDDRGTLIQYVEEMTTTA